jgi:hypothetical protein
MSVFPTFYVCYLGADASKDREICNTGRVGEVRANVSNGGLRKKKKLSQKFSCSGPYLYWMVILKLMIQIADCSCKLYSTDSVGIKIGLQLFQQSGVGVP